MLHWAAHIAWSATTVRNSDDGSVSAYSTGSVGSLPPSPLFATCRSLCCLFNTLVALSKHRLLAVQAWGMLNDKIQPVVQRMPILQKVLGFVQHWFLSLDPQRQAS